MLYFFFIFYTCSFLTFKFVIGETLLYCFVNEHFYFFFTGGGFNCCLLIRCDGNTAAQLKHRHSYNKIKGAGRYWIDGMQSGCVIRKYALPLSGQCWTCITTSHPIWRAAENLLRPCCQLSPCLASEIPNRRESTSIVRNPLNFPQQACKRSYHWKSC